MDMLTETKAFARIDGDEEDQLILSFIEAAKTFIYDETDYQFDRLSEEDPVACLALKFLVAHWYEDRQPTGKGFIRGFSLESLLVKLQSRFGGWTDEDWRTESTH